MYRECWRESVAGESSRSERSSRRVVARLRAGWPVSVHAAAGLVRKRVLGQMRGAPSRVTVHRGPTERCMRPRVEAEHMVCSRQKASWAAASHRRAACILVELVEGAAAAGQKAPPALRFGGVSGE